MLLRSNSNMHCGICTTKHFLQNFTPHTLLQQKQLNISKEQLHYIQQFHENPDIILTKTDKNMGWGLVPTSWFNTEYTRQLSDNTTYRLIDNFDFDSTVSTSNTLLKKLKLRFDKLLTSTNDKQLLQPIDKNKLQVPYMKLLPKVHKLDETASTDNLNKLTGRPIITAHSWLTSNPSRLLGTELDNLILGLKDLFSTQNIPFPLIYNSTDLLNLLHNINIDHIDNFCLTTFDFTSLYTNISYHDTIHAIVTSCKLLNLPNFYRDYLLNLNNFINNRNFFTVGNTTYQQIHGVAMGSYHSRQIADLVLLLSEFSFFNTTNTNGIFIFCRYIDDGFMLTNKSNINSIITNLASTYPSQIPITFTSNCHSVHYLDLTLSLNHHTIRHHKIHYQVYQKPHHKYMYPHFTSNHPRHIFSGIIKTETIRYSRLSSTADDYNFIHKLFTLRLTALQYPNQLITTNSFPWLTHATHLRRKNYKKLTKQDKLTVYYRTKFNKHLRTDKIVRNILHKYHNLRIPKLSKAYNNSTKLHTMLLTNKVLHHKLSKASSF